MLLVRIKERLPLRIAEWLAALAMIGIGLYLVVWPGAFTRAGLSGFAAIAPVGTWIAASLILGALRIFALVLNGHMPHVSAPIRMVGAILGVGLFASVAAGYALAQTENGPPLGVIFALAFVAGDLFSSARTAWETHDATRRLWTGFSR